MSRLGIRKMLLIDGGGAFLSSVLIGIVLVEYQTLIGMPARILYLLSSIPLLFTVYDAISYLSKNADHNILLKGIAYANMGYILISAILIILHRKILTGLGLAYFCTEIVILVFLVMIELRIANRKE